MGHIYLWLRQGPKVRCLSDERFQPYSCASAPQSAPPSIFACLARSDTRLSAMLCTTATMWLLAAALVAATAAPAEPADCNNGCVLGKPSFVCGADGVTYASDCLALCAGTTTVVYPGPCAAAGSPAAAAAMAAAASGGPMPPPVDPNDHPVASLLAASADGDGTVKRVASPADMRRFSAEGLVLAGVVKLSKSAEDMPELEKKGRNPEPGAE